MEYIQIPSERLRRSMPKVFAQVEGGGKSFEVTSNGRPVARIVPVDDHAADEIENADRQVELADSGSLPAEEIADLPFDAP